MTARDWMERGTDLFLSTVDGLTDGELDAPTGLPGWTRRHVVAHVHYNAEALRRLVNWARTGEQTPMYVDAEQRAAEIETGARRPVAALRDDVRSSAATLIAEYDALSADALRAVVRTAQGREVPATEIAWMRSREVCVHAVDLGTGVTFADLPREFTTALVAEVAAKHAGDGGAAGLAAWLTGRGEPPALGRWL